MSQTQTHDLNLTDLDARVQAAIQDAMESKVPELIAIAIEATQRMMDIYDQLIDNPPPIIPGLSEENVEKILELMS